MYSETNREHWEKVLNKGISPLQRKSVLIPDTSTPHSSTRFGQLKEHISSADEKLRDFTFGFEDAPFLFSPSRSIQETDCFETQFVECSGCVLSCIQ